MAENFRSYEEILEELFFSKDAAIEKYAKVRHTLYEIQLWRKENMPLREIGRAEKIYFSHSFLSGQRIDKVNSEFIENAIIRLQYANGIGEDGNLTNTGCRARCYRLMDELNEALKRIGLPKVDNIQSFIDWLTFNYHTPIDAISGNPIKEPGYNVEVRIFHDKDNRQDFLTEIKSLIKEGKRMSMQDIYQIVKFKRKRAKSAPAKPKAK